MSLKNLNKQCMQNRQTVTMYGRHNICVVQCVQWSRAEIGNEALCSGNPWRGLPTLDQETNVDVRLIVNASCDLCGLWQTCRIRCVLSLTQWKIKVVPSFFYFFFSCFSMSFLLDGLVVAAGCCSRQFLCQNTLTGSKIRQGEASPCCMV